MHCKLYTNTCIAYYIQTHAYRHTHRPTDRQVHAFPDIPTWSHTHTHTPTHPNGHTYTPDRHRHQINPQKWTDTCTTHTHWAHPPKRTDAQLQTYTYMPSPNCIFRNQKSPKSGTHHNFQKHICRRISTFKNPSIRFHGKITGHCYIVHLPC